MVQLWALVTNIFLCLLMENYSNVEEYPCEWCGRTFVLRTLDRHAPFCKEHVHRYGKPMNPRFYGANQDRGYFTNEKEACINALISGKYVYIRALYTNLIF